MPRSNVDKAWFIDRMRERSFSLRKLAAAMKMHPSALSRALNGERKVAAPEARRMAELLDAPESQVLARLDQANGPRKGAGADTGASGSRRHPGFEESQMVFKGEPDIENEDYIVPPQGADPLFGCMAGTLTLLPDIDYAAPADPDWGKVYDD